MLVVVVVLKGFADSAIVVEVKLRACSHRWRSRGWVLMMLGAVR